jgi:outer membrane immunogenic protein
MRCVLGAVFAALAACCASQPASAASKVRWDGFYIGAHGGYLQAGTDYSNPDTPGQDLDGGVFGGQVGYSYQTSHLVFGVEADATFGDLDAHVNDGNYLKYSGDLKAFGTIRARLGYAIGDFMPYITGGLAWARLEQGSSCPAGAPIFSVCFFTGAYDVKSTETFWGWTIGGGGEWAIDKSWSLKAEALFTDFDDETYTATINGTPVSAPAELEVDSRLTIGVNYRF